MSGPEFTPDARRAMTPARKARIHQAAGGVCYFCRQPVEVEGPGVEYDHVTALWMAGSDADEAIAPIHTEPCHRLKTAADASKRAKVKRLHGKAPRPRQAEAQEGADAEPASTPLRKGRRLQGRGFQGWRTFKGDLVRRDR